MLVALVASSHPAQAQTLNAVKERTNSPKTIGHLVASGCIRLVNDDVEDLYRRVSLETRVVFVS